MKDSNNPIIIYMQEKVSIVMDPSYVECQQQVSKAMSLLFNKPLLQFNISNKIIATLKIFYSTSETETLWKLEIDKTRYFFI